MDCANARYPTDEPLKCRRITTKRADLVLSARFGLLFQELRRLSRPPNGETNYRVRRFRATSAKPRPATLKSASDDGSGVTTTRET